VKLVSRWTAAERFPLVRSKFGRILELVENREVLDCGCVGSVAESRDEVRQTSHEMIAQRARYCLGIDIWREEVEKRRALGYNVVWGNVEQMSLERTFDVIVAADLIEHLANPGMFLDRAGSHLREDGVLCLVTPNAHSLNTSAKALLGVKIAANPEHTCWYDPTTLRQLLARHGFRSVEEYWQDYLKSPLAEIVMRLRPNLAAHYIVIARKEGIHEAR